eukprot:3691124-Pleurochrysis_carterae.AAC.1
MVRVCLQWCVCAFWSERVRREGEKVRQSAPQIHPEGATACSCRLRRAWRFDNAAVGGADGRVDCQLLERRRQLRVGAQPRLHHNLVCRRLQRARVHEQGHRSPSTARSVLCNRPRAV